MLDLVRQYLWIASLPLVTWYAIQCERRAYGLAGAGLVSDAEAARFTRWVWVSALALMLAVLVPQLTYGGPRGYCAWYSDPLRPGALTGWLLFAGVLLRVGSLVTTPSGRMFLTRVWPAAMINQPLSRVWPQRKVVRSTLLGVGLPAVIIGWVVWMSITRPGSTVTCVTAATPWWQVLALHVG